MKTVTIVINFEDEVSDLDIKGTLGVGETYRWVEGMNDDLRENSADNCPINNWTMKLGDETLSHGRKLKYNFNGKIGIVDPRNIGHGWSEIEE